MLLIKTDSDNIHWLQYILDEFTRINAALFSIRIVPLDSTDIGINAVCYSSSVQNSPTFYAHPKPYLNSDVDYLRPDLFILRGTKMGGTFIIDYDLFWNAFVFLSRYEEYACEKTGKLIHSYSYNHPRKNTQSFEIPIVNMLFNELEKILRHLFPELPFGNKVQPKIELSHDVDYLTKTVQLRIKQTLFNGFNLLKSIKHLKQFLPTLQKTISFAFSTPSYWCFDYWEMLEKHHGLRSTFYIYVKAGKRSWLSWLIDPSYDIQNDNKLRNKLKSLIANGFSVGLHGSYKSATNPEQLSTEKQILEHVTGSTVTKTRQHWLNYQEQITPYAHERLFKYDSTIGWNDRMGFRSGIASAYRPYDHINQRAMNYMIVPQIIMDSHLFDYAHDADPLSSAKIILERSKIVSKQTHVSISWHQRVCSSDYNWHREYEELLNVI